MPTAQDILERAQKRYNGATMGYGQLTREDVVDFIAQLSPELNKKDELNAFLSECTFLSPTDKNKLLNDLKSYGL